MKLKKLFQTFQRDERGVTALEYAILAGVVVVAVSALSGTISDLYKSTFSTISTKISNTVSSTGTGTGTGSTTP